MIDYVKLDLVWSDFQLIFFFFNRSIVSSSRKIAVMLINYLEM